MPHTHNPPEGDRIVQITSIEQTLLALTVSGRVWEFDSASLSWSPVPGIGQNSKPCEVCEGTGDMPDHPDGKCTYCHGAGWVNADPEPVAKEYATLPPLHPLPPLPEVWNQSKLPDRVTGEPGEMCLNCMGHGHKNGRNCAVCGGTGIFTDSDL